MNHTRISLRVDLRARLISFNITDATAVKASYHAPKHLSLSQAVPSCNQVKSSEVLGRCFVLVLVFNVPIHSDAECKDGSWLGHGSRVVETMD